MCVGLLLPEASKKIHEGLLWEDKKKTKQRYTAKTERKKFVPILLAVSCRPSIFPSNNLCLSSSFSDLWPHRLIYLWVSHSIYRSSEWLNDLCKIHIAVAGSILFPAHLVFEAKRYNVFCSSFQRCSGSDSVTSCSAVSVYKPWESQLVTFAMTLHELKRMFRSQSSVGSFDHEQPLTALVCRSKRWENMQSCHAVETN